MNRNVAILFLVGGCSLDGGAQSSLVAASGPVCGDGRRDDGEVCDDGNAVDDDGCDASCAVPRCLVPVTHATVAALLADAACTTGYLEPGTYRENVVIERSVILHGQGAILDGGGADSVIRTAPDTDVLLTGLTVRNGRARSGGGIASGGALTLREVRVADNVAVERGGGIASDGPLTVERSVVAGNRIETAEPAAVVSGGGISANASLTLSDSGISSNAIEVTGGRSGRVMGAGVAVAATGRLVAGAGTVIDGNTLVVSASGLLVFGAGVAVEGGAMLTGVRILGNAIRATGGGLTLVGAGAYLVPEAEPVITCTLVAGNVIDGTAAPDTIGSASGAGLAIASNRAGLATIDRSFIDGNRLELRGDQDNVAAGGAGISAARVALRLINTSVSSNQLVVPSGVGGGLLLLSSSTEIENATISGNAIRGTSTHGGGIEVSGEVRLVVENTTISGNSALAGGGISANGNSTISLARVTITANQAQTTGGIAVRVPLVVASSLIAGNVGGDCAAVDVVAEAPNVYGSPGCARGEDLVVADAGLAALADNGGGTLTHALLPTSPARDVARCVAGATDQRGHLRSSPRCDAGAFERD